MERVIKFMPMIDWVSVGFGALWVLGLGLVTAALSFANYLAGQQKQRFSQVLEIPVYRIMLALGLVFFCLGWAGNVSTTWEHLLWAVLALMFALQTWHARKMSHA
jgi:hypothetical protein